MAKWENTQGKLNIMQIDTSVALYGEDDQQIKQEGCIAINTS